MTMSEQELLPHRGRIKPNLDAPEASPTSDAHSEWLIDVAVEQTFPASDASAAVIPGSTAGRRAEGLES